MRRAWTVPGRRVGPASAALAGLLAVLTIAPGPTVGASTGPALTKIQLFDTHIDHIVFLMQENHAFDNLFGLYCPAVGPHCPYAAHGIPPGVCMPVSLTNASKGCVPPFNLTSLKPADLRHTWGPSHASYNGGKMNGWVPAEAHNETMGHYNASMVPVYYDMAEQYALADDFFSGALSYSLPNHWFEVAPTAPPVAEKKIPGQTPGVSLEHAYLNQSNATATIEDELVNSSVSWKYYDYPLQSYANSIAPVGPLNAYNLWNPLAARAQSYAAATASHFVGRGAFFNDSANGTLPNISWLIPSQADSDHPPASLGTGQSWVASVVDAVESSPDWNTTALFISWDEYGGFYDHVVPPLLDAYGDGFRVPLLVLGPWVRPGYIDHTTMDFSSVLHLMEVRFGLACLGPRDCNAALPLHAFNFSFRQPRAPIQFPGYGQARYPMPPQAPGLLPSFDATGPPPLPDGLNGRMAFDPGEEG